MPAAPTTVVLYATVVSPVGNAAVEIDGAVFSVSSRLAVTGAPAASVSVSTTVAVAPVGVPEITPVAALSSNGVGKPV